MSRQRKKKGRPVSGWVVLDKPVGMGSTEAVSKVKWLFQAEKAGHAGTLDPLASGMLPIALGEATKTVSFMVEAGKGYRFTIAWGTSTTTLDREGAVTATSQVRPTREAIEAALSADHVTLSMDCGKGTYVRAIARDLATALGAEAHVSELRRTHVGPFGAQGAITLEKLEDLVHRGAGQEALLPVETALDDIPVLAVTDEDAFRLSQGRGMVLLPRQVETVRATLKGDDRTVLASHKGQAAAICEMRAGQLRPIRVFNL